MAGNGGRSRAEDRAPAPDLYGPGPAGLRSDREALKSSGQQAQGRGGRYGVLADFDHRLRAEHWTGCRTLRRADRRARTECARLQEVGRAAADGACAGPRVEGRQAAELQGCRRKEPTRRLDGGDPSLDPYDGYGVLPHAVQGPDAELSAESLGEAGRRLLEAA